MTFTIDIPGVSKTSGGIQRMLEFYNFLKKDYKTFLHLPNDDLQKCDYIISYSDNPRIDDLCLQAKSLQAKVIIYQLSYGMALERERKVVLHPETIICTSTHHIKNKIKLDLINNCKDQNKIKKPIHYIGHSQESTLKYFYVDNRHNRFDVAIMIHKSPDKRFLEAFEYCKQNHMSICLFGTRGGNFDLFGADEVFFDASPTDIRWIFNNSKKFLNLSSTEGLNRTGIEAMLCGCTPYIVDGCEIYQNRHNCIKIRNSNEIHEKPLILDYNTIKDSLKQFTWDNTFKNLMEVL